MSLTLETLLAFLSGSLSSADREVVREFLRSEPRAAELLVQQILLSDAARECFADDLKQPIPDAWVAMIERATLNSSEGNVMGMAAHRSSYKSRIPRWSIGLSMAASVALAIYFVADRPSQALINFEEGHILASADLSRALDEARSGMVIPIGTNRHLDVQLSLRKSSGSFCREAIVEASGVDLDQHILACKDGEDWQILAIATAASQEDGLAAVNSGRPLDNLVMAVEGEALDRLAEQQAIRMKWQNPRVRQ